MRPACALCVSFLVALPATAQSLVRSVPGPAAFAQYGKACVVVPDQNGDGFKDVLVGAPSFNQERGAIYCLSGSFIATGTGTQTLWSVAPAVNQGDLFGTSIADVGDVTGDGVHDFLVGQPGYDQATVNDRGAVRLVNGSSHAVVSLIFGTSVSAVFGTAIAATGDLDYDGRSEVLVGAPGTGTAFSRLYLIRGSDLQTSDWIENVHSGRHEDLVGGWEMGTSIAAGFDYQDLGTFVVSDFVMGAPGFDGPAGADTGKVMLGSVTFGGGTPSIHREYVSPSPGERLGTSVDAVHDYDGDGRVDLVVGAPNAANGTPTENGRVVVLSHTALITSTPPYEMYSLPFFVAPTQHGQDYHFGAAVRACADLNGDGIGEILAGAPDYFTAFSAAKGGVAVYSGATGTRFAFIQGATNDRLGDALAGALDDLDGNGFEEFVIAGSRSDAGGTDSGVVKCYRVFPLQPSTYCAGKLNSLGCIPLIGFSGSPSASSGAPFLVTASNFLNQKTGLLFYSHAPAAVLFQGGTKCVANPTVRTPPQSSGGATSGSSCTGTYSLDFNAWSVNGIDPTLVAGAEVYAQYWSRDPASPSHTSLSNALRFVINP